MLNLAVFKLIPTPYKVLAILVLIALYTGFIFKKGMDYKEGQIAVEQNELIQQTINNHNAKQSQKLENALKSLERISAIDKKMDKLKLAVEKDIATKKVFKNKDCVLDSESLNLWNGVAK